MVNSPGLFSAIIEPFCRAVFEISSSMYIGFRFATSCSGWNYVVKSVNNGPEKPGTQPNDERKKRGQQTERPAPKRRDRSHLPVRVEVIDLPDEEKVCVCCVLPLSDPGCSKDSEQIEIEIELNGGYKAMQQVKDGNLLLAFCGAHVRRDFVRIGKGFPELKDRALTKS